MPSEEPNPVLNTTIRPRRVDHDAYNEVSAMLPGRVHLQRISKGYALEQSRKDLKTAQLVAMADRIAQEQRHFYMSCWACGLESELPPLAPGENSEAKVKEVMRTTQKCPRCKQRAVKVKELRR